MLTDKDVMTFGQHKGKALANVPADYLLHIYSYENLNKDLKQYIKDNLEVLKAEMRRRPGRQEKR